MAVHDMNPGGLPQRYPRFPSTPVTGDPGNPDITLPYDLWPSAHNHMAYPTHMQQATRVLAGVDGGLGGQPGGLGSYNAEETTHYAGLSYARKQAAHPGDASGQDYPQELETLAAMDDTSGNGIFDAHNSYPNVNEDAGVFADAWSMPGYLAREKMFDGKGEVIDVNTGRPVVYIPATEFMIDRRLPGMLADEQLYIPGWPNVPPASPVPGRSTVVPDGPSWNVGRRRGVGDSATPPPGEKAMATKGEMFAMAAIAGLSIGLVVGLVAKKRK